MEKSPKTGRLNDVRITEYISFKALLGKFWLNSNENKPAVQDILPPVILKTYMKHQPASNSS